jgi:hypothetical protein
MQVCCTKNSVSPRLYISHPHLLGLLTLIPVEPQPLEVPHHGLLTLTSAAGLVSVLDTAAATESHTAWCMMSKDAFAGFYCISNCGVVLHRSDLIC